MARTDRYSKKEINGIVTHTTHQLKQLYIKRAECVAKLNKTFLQADAECNGNLSYARYVKVQLSLKSTLERIDREIKFYQEGKKQCGQ